MNDETKSAFFYIDFFFEAIFSESLLTYHIEIV